MSDIVDASLALLRYLPAVAMWYLILGLLEWRFAARERKSTQGWLFNLEVSSLYLLAPVLASGSIAWLVASARSLTGGGLLDLRVPGNGVLATLSATLLFLLIFDFFYYWWHRLQHESKTLWAIHKLHHMDETLGVSTALRHHWLEDIGRVLAIAIPMALLFDLTPATGGIIASVLAGWTAFIHANLKLHLGPATRLITGPQVHRVHHSRHPEHADRNFAAFFPFYDVLFRTYYEPRRDEFPPTGVVEEPAIRTLPEAAWLPFRDCHVRGLRSAWRRR